MNKGLAATMNDDIPGINIRNLPCSLLMMINLYSHYKHLDKATEYLLYIRKGSPYILWIKYGKIATLKKREGFEIRSFYKCIEQRDLDKYNGTNDLKIADEIFIAI